MNGIGKAQVGTISVLALMLVSITRRLPERKFSSGTTTTLALAGIVLLVAAGSASAVTVINSCNFNANTANEYYVLGSDISCTTGQQGIIIGADGVTIDGYNATDSQYYKITGNAASANCTDGGEVTPCTVSGIYNVEHDNVTIKNLEIEKFCTGIALDGYVGPPARRIRNNTIDNCSIHDNGFNTTNQEMITHGIHACYIDSFGNGDVPALTITNNDISNNEGSGGWCGAGGNGIFIYAGGSWDEYCNISYNELNDNAKAGFWTKYMLSKCSITHNNASGNGGGSGITDDVRGGIILRCKLSDYNNVSYNNVSNNVGTQGGSGVGYGIYVGGNHNNITNNTANKSTKHGICMCRTDGSSYTELRNNTVCKNDHDGIHLVGVIGNTLYDNFVCDNGQVSGVDICDGGATGDNNTCNTASGYCDDSADCPPPCVYYCPGVGPDLVISNKFETWNVTGVDYKINYTVTNVGDTYTANVSNVSVYIDGSHVATDSVPELAAGASYTNELGPFSIRNGAPDTIRLRADWNNTTSYANVTNETNTLNNNCTNVFGAPDLRITGSHPEWSCKQTKSYYVNYTIENGGDADAGAFNVSINASGTMVYDAVSSLNKDTSRTNVVGPFTMSGDSDYIKITVDCNGTVTENDETNNYTQRMVGAPADPPEDGYVAYKYQVDGSPGPGDPSIEFNSTEYANVKTDDALEACNTTTTNGYYAAHRFNFSVEHTSDIDKINVTWIGTGNHDSAGATKGAKLYIYNFTSSGYEELDSSTTGPPTEITLTGEKTSSISNYISPSGNVTVLVNQTSAHGGRSPYSHICTDYIQLRVERS